MDELCAQLIAANCAAFHAVLGKMFNRLKFMLAFVVCLSCAGGGSDRPAPPAVAQAAADSLARARQDSINRTLPGYVVDSIRSIEEELRRFRLAVGEGPVSSLKSGARSRDALVATFVKALEAGDKATIESLALSAREFADLVYPESPYTRPPYRQPPGLLWSQIESSSATGLGRLMTRLGGSPLGYQSQVCEKDPEKQGSNRIWSGCVLLTLDTGNAVRRRQLFGPIIEREGRFKFVTLSNEF